MRVSRRTLLTASLGGATIRALAQAKPYAGRTMVIVTAHADDFTILAGGTIARMIDEGYTAHVIRVTNDEKDSHDLGPGETSHRNTVEMRKAADIMGIREIHSLVSGMTRWTRSRKPRCVPG
jgi:LmbE family N-acetylglucosaminyl deacetylase